MLFMAATTFTRTHCSRTDTFRCCRNRSAKIHCATETEDFAYLIVSTTAAATPARKSSSVTGTMPTATGFLRTRFVDLERAAFDIHAVEFSNGPFRIIFRPEFHESITARAARISIGDYAGGDRLIALLGKQLQQALISNVVRQMQSSVLIGSTPATPKAELH